jgi:prepilin-type processing-associated H-X9-DG protein
MPLRPSRVLPAILLLTAIVLIPACKKKAPDGGGGDPPGPSGGSSGYVLFAHLKTKDVLDSDLFAEVKKAFAKEGGNVWDMAEQEVAKNLGGIKPTDVDSVAVFVTEVPERDVPKFVLILAANKPINKAGVFNLGPQTKPDARGFYRVRQNAGLIHFPDDKTLVALHPDLADKYLAGYAKDRGGWPMTADLKAAAVRHTLYAEVDVTKVPRAMLDAVPDKEFAPLLKAQRLTVAADLKGKEISATVRAAFPDADAATKARDTAQKLVGMATGVVDQFASKGAADLGAFLPAVKEAQRALKAIKIEASGSELTVAGSYKIDFDLGAVAADAAKKVREAAVRMTDSNNLKQIGLALHTYADANGGPLPVHAVTTKGQPLKNAKDKPLLSWRVAILPYIEQEALYREFKLDEPWDSEHNKKLIAKMPTTFAPANKSGKPGHTHLQMVIGPGAMDPVGVRIPATFKDGMSNTIAVVEAATPVIWTKPDDVMLPEKDPPKDLKKKFGGLHRNGFNVLLWDGSVRFISDSIDERTLRLLLDPKDGQPIPGDY